MKYRTVSASLLLAFPTATPAPPDCPEWEGPLRRSLERAREMKDNDREFLEAVAAVSCQEFVRACQPKEKKNPCD